LAPIAVEQVVIKPQLTAEPPCGGAHPVNTFKVAPLRLDAILAQPPQALDECEADRARRRRIRSDGSQRLGLKSSDSHRSLSIRVRYAATSSSFRLSAGGLEPDRSARTATLRVINPGGNDKREAVPIGSAGRCWHRGRSSRRTSGR